MAKGTGAKGKKNAAKSLEYLIALLRTQLHPDIFRSAVPLLAAMDKLTQMPYPLERRTPVNLIEVAGALRATLLRGFPFAEAFAEAKSIE